MGQQASLPLPVASAPKYGCVPVAEDEEWSFVPKAGASGGSDFQLAADCEEKCPTDLEVVNKLLYQAVRNKEKSEISPLIARGAALTPMSPAGSSPLHLAVSLGFKDMVVELIRCGSPLNEVNKEKNTPLHVAVKSARSPGIVDVLIGAGAFVDAVDKDLRTPLHVAALHGNLLAVVKLCDNGARRGVHDKDGERPIDLATRFGRTRVATFLGNLDHDIALQKIKKYEQYM